METTMKKKEPSHERNSLPFLRIEVSELLQVLERVSAGKHKISAETNSLEFESIEEIRSHKAEFAQRPRVNIGPVEFDSGTAMSPPSLSITLYKLRREDNKDAVPQAQVLLKALEKELLAYRSRLANPYTGVFLSLCVGLVCLVFFLIWAGDQPLSFSYVVQAIAVVWIAQQATGFVLKRLVGEDTIFYRPRETWLQRHSSELVVGVLAAAVSGVVGSIVTLLLSK